MVFKFFSMMKSHWITLVASTFFLLSFNAVSIAQNQNDIPTLERISARKDANNNRNIKLGLKPNSTFQQNAVSVFQFPGYIQVVVDGIQNLGEAFRRQELDPSDAEAIPRDVVKIREVGGSMWMDIDTQKNTGFYILQDEQELRILTQPATPQNRVFTSTQKSSLRQILRDLVQQQRQSFFIFAPKKDVGLWVADLSSQQVLKQLLKDYGLNERHKNGISVYAPSPALKRFKPDFFQKTYNGDAISVYFVDIDVLSMIYIIQDFSDRIFITSRSDLGSLTINVVNRPWPEVLDYITTGQGLEVQKFGEVSVVASPDELALAHERGCFTSPAFEGFGLSKIELQHVDLSDITRPLLAEIEASGINAATPACEMLELTPRIRGDGKIVDVYASTAVTREIRDIIEQLDKPRDASPSCEGWMQFYNMFVCLDAGS